MAKILIGTACFLVAVLSIPVAASWHTSGLPPAYQACVERCADEADPYDNGGQGCVDTDCSELLDAHDGEEPEE